jgi:biopolymer transport protein ExbB
MIFSILLQSIAAADSIQDAASEVISTGLFNTWAIIQKGGLIIIPIGFLFVLAIYIFIERYISIHRVSASGSSLLVKIKQLMTAQKIDEAQQLCSANKLPIARMLEKGIHQRTYSGKEIEESMQAEGKFELYKIEKGLPILAMIAGIAPMFGFLGTILGVIKIFFDISQSADVSIGAVSAGLYVKMVSSAAGLIVGVLSYIFYHTLNIKIAKITNNMERNAQHFLEYLKDNKQ